MKLRLSRLPDVSTRRNRSFAAAIGALLIGLAWWLCGVGLDGLSDARKLERLNTTPLMHMSGGVYRVAGSVEPLPGSSVEAPYSGDRVLWVEYREERQVRVGGVQQWRTVEEGTKGVDKIALRDQSGTVLLDTAAAFSADGQVRSVDADQLAEWDLRLTYQYREATRRYTERALLAAPQDLQAIGEFDPDTGMLRLAHTPAMPSYVSVRNIGSIGGESLVKALAKLGAAVLALSMGTGLVLVGMGIHRFWIFILLMSGAVMVQLMTLGGRHLAGDWQAAMIIAHERNAAVQALGDRRLPEHQQDVADLMAQMASTASGVLDRRLYRRAAGELAAIAGDSNGRGESNRLDSVPTLMTLGVSVLAFLVSYWMFRSGLGAILIKRLVEALPWNRSGRLSYGMTKKQGIIEAVAGTLETPLSEPNVLVYRELVEELRGYGNSRRWVVISDRLETLPFRLKGEGDVGAGALVNPEQADIDFQHRAQRRISHSPERQVTAWWIEEGASLTVVGHAGLNPEGSAELAIRAEPDAPFLISARPDGAMLLRMASNAFVRTAISFSTFLFGMAALLALRGSVSPDSLLTLVVTVPLFLLLVTAALHYNDLVYLRNAIAARRQHIFTQWQKRADLIPPLERIVKRYLAHERELLALLTELRRAGMTAFADDGLERVLGQQQALQRRIISGGEAYPELMSEPVVRRFQDTMRETEDYLAFLRDAHLKSCELYNTRIATFPDLLLARPLGFQPVSLTLSPHGQEASRS
jgi:hypothetical protein